MEKLINENIIKTLNSIDTTKDKSLVDYFTRIVDRAMNTTGDNLSDNQRRRLNSFKHLDILVNAGVVNIEDKKENVDLITHIRNQFMDETDGAAFERKLKSGYEFFMPLSYSAFIRKMDSLGSRYGWSSAVNPYRYVRSNRHLPFILSKKDVHYVVMYESNAYYRVKPDPKKGRMATKKFTLNKFPENVGKSLGNILDEYTHLLTLSYGGEVMNLHHPHVFFMEGNSYEMIYLSNVVWQTIHHQLAIPAQAPS